MIASINRNVCSFKFVLLGRARARREAIRGPSSWRLRRHGEERAEGRRPRVGRDLGGSMGEDSAGPAGVGEGLVAGIWREGGGADADGDGHLGRAARPRR